MLTKTINPMRIEGGGVTGWVIEYRLFGALLYKKTLNYPPDIWYISNNVIHNF